MGYYSLSRIQLYNQKTVCYPTHSMELEKQPVITKFRINDKDTGSPEVQIALISQRIEHLTEHFKGHVKDHQSRRGLLKLVGQRRRLLGYLRNRNTDRYQKVTKELGLRK